MIKRNVKGLKKYTKSKNKETIEKVNTAIDKLKRSRKSDINFSTVAKEAGVSKATLYNNEILKERILSLRTGTKGVPNIIPPDKSFIRAADKGYFDEIRKLREDKKNLILQLVEFEALRNENAKLMSRLCKKSREDSCVFMKVSDLKTILEGFNGNDEIAVAVTVNDKKIHVVTHDVEFDRGEYGELMLKTAVYSADFDY